MSAGGRRSNVLPYLALALLLAVSLTYRVREISDRVDLLRHGAERARDPFTSGFAEPELLDVQPEAEATGIAEGDTLLAFADRPYRGAVDFHAPMRVARAGDVVAVKVRSAAGAIKNVSMVLKPYRATPLTGKETVEQVIGNVMPVFCILLGFWVAGVRIRDGRAWLFLAMMMSFGEISGGGLVRSWFGHDDLFQPIGVFYQQFVSNTWGAAMLLFGIYFPERFEADRRWPWAKWLLVGVILFWATQIAFAVALAGRHAALAAAILEWLPERGSAAQLVHMIAVGGFFAAIAHKSFSAKNRDARRRLLLLYAGATVSLTPVFIFVLIGLVNGQSFFEMESGLLSFFLLVMILGFPLTMAYVIVVERAMDVRVVIRQGLQYLLASKGVLVLQILLSAVVIFAAASMAVGDTNRPQRIQLIAGGIFGVAIIRLFSMKLRTWIDRRFFREAYDAEQLLSELANKVRTMVETGPLLETVATRISESLHIPRVAVLLNGGGALRLAYAVGYMTTPDVLIPVDSPDMEKSARTQLDAELVLPLSLNQKILGALTLGPKRSEEPYSKADVRLLGSVATQTGLALENSRLTAEVAAEVAERVKTNREMEIAREVQERLFPQELPDVAGLECAATCRPALGVGGDYYDFLQLPDGKLGIAIGDVSGKGIPAALLMAGLRASLRGQTIQGADDLAALMSNVSQLVYESSSSNRYATFFYGQYEPATRQLTYVNGGHNPPMVFRGNDEVLRLDVGGPVVGLLPGVFAYQQGTVTFQSGDTFVAFTDGISEAMNAEYEEWGEERLIACARELRQRAAVAEEMMTELIAAADRFVAGAKQHDDMTIIVARIL